MDNGTVVKGEPYNKEELEKSLFPARQNPEVALSNALIQAREKTSLLESKIELLAIARMNETLKTREKKDARGKKYDVHYVTLKTAEIKYLTGRKGGGLYQQIFSAVTELKKKLYYYADDEGNFKIDNIYGECEYRGGQLTIEFNPATEHLFLELKKNFSRIPLGIALSFKSNGGFQLYKLLKTKAYTLPEIDLSLDQSELPSKTFSYNLSEFRMMLGYVDLEQKGIAEEAGKKIPNYDKIDEIEKKTKPKYRRWSDFYAKVLEPGQYEINNMSDIYIAAIDTKKGAHGRIEGVDIVMQLNKKFYEEKQNEKRKQGRDQKSSKVFEAEKNLSEDDKLSFLEDMGDIIKEPIKIKDLKAIAEAADWEMTKIKAAYEIAENSHSQINNLTGFMIAAIKEQYDSVQKEDYDTEEGRWAAEHREEIKSVYEKYKASRKS